jgi:hypothetical protein
MGLEKMRSNWWRKKDGKGEMKKWYVRDRLGRDRLGRDDIERKIRRRRWEGFEVRKRESWKKCGEDGKVEYWKGDVSKEEDEKWQKEENIKHTHIHTHTHTHTHTPRQKRRREKRKVWKE